MVKKSLVSIACSLFVALVAPGLHADEAVGRSDRGQQFLAKAQKICPVTGKDLTSMGGPFKAELDGQTVFLCCRGCVGRPLNPKHSATVATNLQSARLALAQQICPVSGKDLLSMGGPIKAEVAGQTVFLCCKACFKGQVQQEHWNQIRSFRIAAQGTCPVMENPLPEDATSIVVKGREVFVCCPPCTEKIEASPDKFVAIVDQLIAANLESRSQNN